MLSTSNAFKSAIKADIRRFKGRLTIKSTVYESDKISDFTYLSSCMAGETYAVGSTIASTLKIKLCLIVEGLKDLDPVKAEIGLVLPDGTTEWVTLGQFLITKYDPNRNDLTTSIEAMDSFILMEGPYESKLTYPATIEAVATEIANLAGVKANASSFSKLSSTIKIDKPEGYTFRQAIGLIAQFEAGFARFNRQGELDIRGLEDPNYEVTPAEYFQKGLTKNEVMYRLGGISCKVRDESTNEEQEYHVGSRTGTQISLDNKIMTQYLLEQIYSKLKNINFYPFSLDWRGNPALEVGDWITVTDKRGTRFKVPNLTYELKFNGGLSAKSSADTRATSETTYKQKNPIDQKFDDLKSELEQGLAGASGNTIYDGLDEPAYPKEGDIWFKPNGPDTEMWIYENGKWVMKISTAFDPNWEAQFVETKKEIENAKLAAANAAAQALQNSKDLAAANSVIGSLQVTVNDFKNSVQSQFTVMEGQVTSVVQQMKDLNTTNRNYFINSIFYDKTKWLTLGTYSWDIDNTIYQGNKSAKIVAKNSTTSSNSFYQTFDSSNNLKTNERIFVSFYVKASSATTLSVQSGTGIAQKINVTTSWQKHTIETTVGSTKRIYFYTSSDCTLYLNSPMLCVNRADWTLAPEDQIDRSQITQLIDQIDLRVTDLKNGIINAINISQEGILIQGNRVWITGTTKIDNAVIKDAMIDSMTANKLTAGTINAALINVINLNANNLASGTINAKVIKVINLDASQITSGQISGTYIKNGAITADKIPNGEITGTLIKDNAIVTSKIAANAINASKIAANSITADKLTGNFTQFVKSAWNGINSNIEITGDGILSKRSDSSISAKYLSDGIQIWGNGKWAGSLSWATGPNVVLWAKTGHNLNLGYQGSNSSTNTYSTALSINGSNGYIRFYSPIETGASSRAEFRTTSYSGATYPSLTNTTGQAGIMFGTSRLFFLHNNYVWSMEDIVKVIQGLSGKRVYLPGSINSNGTVGSWWTVQF